MVGSPAMTLQRMCANIKVKGLAVVFEVAMEDLKPRRWDAISANTWRGFVCALTTPPALFMSIKLHVLLGCIDAFQVDHKSSKQLA